jgi:hypothetical protein
MNGRSIGELKKDIEESGCGLIGVLLQDFPGGTGENHENSQSGQLSSQLRTPPTYKSEVLKEK